MITHERDSVLNQGICIIIKSEISFTPIAERTYANTNNFSAVFKRIVNDRLTSYNVS